MTKTKVKQRLILKILIHKKRNVENFVCVILHLSKNTEVKMFVTPL